MTLEQATAQLLAAAASHDLCEIEEALAERKGTASNNVTDVG